MSVMNRKTYEKFEKVEESQPEGLVDFRAYNVTQGAVTIGPFLAQVGGLTCEIRCVPEGIF
jgi:hypothetical protein